MDWNTISDKDLAFKITSLLALTTGKRRGEFHALTNRVELVNGQFAEALIDPDPNFLSKTRLSSRGLGALQPVSVKSLDEVVPNKEDEDRFCVLSARFVNTWSARADTGPRIKRD